MGQKISEIPWLVEFHFHGALWPNILNMSKSASGISIMHADIIICVVSG